MVEMYTKIEVFLERKAQFFPKIEGLERTKPTKNDMKNPKTKESKSNEKTKRRKNIRDSVS